MSSKEGHNSSRIRGSSPYHDRGRDHRSQGYTGQHTKHVDQGKQYSSKSNKSSSKHSSGGGYSSSGGFKTGHMEVNSLYSGDSGTLTVNSMNAPNNSTLQCGCENIDCPFCNQMLSIQMSGQ